MIFSGDFIGNQNLLINYQQIFIEFLFFCHFYPKRMSAFEFDKRKQRISKRAHKAVDKQLYFYF